MIINKKLLNLYKKSKISISELSKTLNIDIWTLVDYLNENNIEPDITYEELKENEFNFKKICAFLK